jgi:hypothetical protein
VYQIQSRADILFFVIVSSLIAAMGALLLAFPMRALPTDVSAYDAASGVLATVKDRSGHKSSRIEFSLQGDARLFESQRVTFRGVADRWHQGSSNVSFFFERRAAEASPAQHPIPVLGLVVDGHKWHGLDEDITFFNAQTGAFGGILALSIGCLGFIVAAVAWRRTAA